MEVSRQNGSAVETVLYGIFTIILLSALSCEIYVSCFPVIRFAIVHCAPSIQRRFKPLITCFNHLGKIVGDFRSGVYYNPFGGLKPVVIRSPDAMQELSESPELSQRAVYADIFGFKYTMSNAEIQMDPNEQTNLRYRLFARAIRINGLLQIDNLRPFLQARLRKTLREKLDPQLINDGWNRITIAPVMRDFATGMLGVYFFGEKLCGEPDFSAAMARYYKDTIFCMGALQIVPACLQSRVSILAHQVWSVLNQDRLVYSMSTNKGHALNVLFERLYRAADSKQDNWEEDGSLKSMTLFHNMIEASAESSYWTQSGIIQAIIGIWFAASHQPWINLHFVFLELCRRPEYAAMILEEVQSIATLDYENIDRLPILDSFIKETVRVNPLDKMSIRRKALKSFTFSNGGPHVAAGKIACAPGWDFMHDESVYPNPNTFDGLRFVKTAHSTATGPSNAALRGLKFIDASKDYPIWGLGSKVCPGRWHSAFIIKMTIIHLVTNYDFRLEDASKSHKWFWETFQMPYESSQVLFRKR